MDSKRTLSKEKWRDWLRFGVDTFMGDRGTLALRGLETCIALEFPLLRSGEEAKEGAAFKSFIVISGERSSMQ